MKTRVTELLNIEYPVIQGGMAWVADANLAAHVSKAGGMGFIGAANAPAEWVKEQIHIARKITDKPVGVNIMLLSDYADEIAQLVIDEHIEAVTTGAGNPSKYMKAWKEAGIRVIPVVASVALARMMERAGADAVVAEGMESGGHIGEETTMTLVPQVVDGLREFFTGKLPNNPMKAEYYLPFAVDALIKDGKATAKVLTTDSRWYGVTYREDKPTICAAVAAMTESGDYPADL